MIWYKLLYFLAYWSRFGLSHCRTVQNEELIEDEKFVLLQSGSDKFIEIRGGEAVLKKGLFPALLPPKVSGARGSGMGEACSDGYFLG